MILLMTVADINGDNDLQIQLSVKQQTFLSTQSIWITVDYTNTGEDTLYIYKWCAPAEQLLVPLFKITCNGQPVHYIGPLIKRPAPTIKDTFPLAPGKTITMKIQLSLAYDMSEDGHYTVQYNVLAGRVIFQLNRIEETFVTEAMSNLESDTIKFAIQTPPNIEFN